ncbi:hypothetical protein MKW92_028312 [Papaver armeniacum]|nr:hypothetical protein MKW92_028312 [Papaver armeniacum]
MESTSRSHNSESSMETDGTTSIRVSLEMAGSTTITGVTVLEHDDVLQSVTIASEPGHCYIMERINPSRYELLPSIVQLFLNGILEPSPGDNYDGNHQVFVITKIEPQTILWRAAVEAMTKIYIIDNDEVARCSICHEEWRAGDDVRRTACGHEFHPSCIETWLIKDKQGSCPNCRFQLIPGGE